MKQIILTNDIIDDYGRVYFKKGTSIELNEQNINRFKNMGIFEKLIKEDIKTQRNPMIKELENKYETIDKELLEEAFSKVHNLMEAIKQKPWYINLNTLANYCEWYYSHSINTAILSIIVAKKLGYSNKKILDLTIGALFHDVGCILIPKEILYKPGKLDKNEEMIVRNHCQLGSASLQYPDFPEKSRLIIEQHHEKNDCSGYPKGIGELDICEEAKIVLITTSLDAATTDRPYKKAISTYEIIEDMKRENTVYCPKIMMIIEEVFGYSKNKV